MEYLYYYIFLIIVIFTISYIGTLNHMNNVKENFTPALREMYRPYVRHARIHSEGFYNKHKNNIHNLFRKIGIM